MSSPTLRLPTLTPNMKLMGMQLKAPTGFPESPVVPKPVIKSQITDQTGDENTTLTNMNNAGDLYKKLDEINGKISKTSEKGTVANNDMINEINNTKDRIQALNLNIADAPKPPTYVAMTDNVKQLFPYVMAIMSVLSLSPEGGGLTGLAETFNGMIGSLRKYNINKFMIANKEFASKLENYKIDTNNKIEEYTSVLKKITAGEDANAEVLKLKDANKNMTLRTLIDHEQVIRQAIALNAKLSEDAKAYELKIDGLKVKRENASTNRINARTRSADANSKIGRRALLNIQTVTNTMKPGNSPFGDSLSGLTP